ncbi:MAG TPA: glycosyltransferase [Solirubrobacteraceae bacterium]|jgi:glycosyltransferase involved in cell wall biosynthesis
MPRSGGPDVTIVSLGSTAGLRLADEALAASLRRAGASVVIVAVERPSQVRTLMLTDLVWARAARRASVRAKPAGATVYSSVTAALLWPVRGAIRFDAPSAGNRPGRHGLWQRPLERLRLRQAPLLLPWSEGGLREAPGGAAAQAAGRTLVLPVPVEPSGPLDGSRDVAALTYAANPRKKGLDRVLAAWREVRDVLPDGAELHVAGASVESLAQAGFGDLEREPGIRVVGALAVAEYRALLRRARVFVCAPRREDYGIAQLEALADGCQLVTNEAPGPYAALPLARRLDQRLVGDDLVGALRAALLEPLPGYAEEARGAIEPFRADTVDRLVAQELLPRLLARDQRR